MKHLKRRTKNLGLSLFLSIAILFFSGCPETTITKGPYLQNVTTDGMTICWETTSACLGAVNYTVSGSMQAIPITVVEDTPRTFHAIRLINLSTETHYDYQIINKVKSSLFDSWVDIPGPQSSFRTSPNIDTPFRFAVWGDSQTNFDTFKTICEGMVSWTPDIAIAVGDQIGDGWILADWKTQVFDPSKELRMKIPTFAAIGNHEAESPYFNKYFSQPGNEHWFSFTYGNSIFVILDTNIWFPYTLQHKWLRELIESDTFKNAKFKFVFFHQPPYTEQWNGMYYDGEPIVRSTLAPILENAGFDIVFNGHTHAYERGRWPIEGEPYLYYIITGGGGGSLDTQEWKDWPQIQFKSSQHHFMIVDVDGDKLSASAVSIDGEIIDSFSK
jgi:acid phosphatase type 7